MKHEPTYTWEDSTQYLRDTNTLEMAQKDFNYWDPETDTSNSWSGTGDFQVFLGQFGGAATDNWRTYKMSAANMVAWNKGKWGPAYTNIDVRGNSVSIPGGKKGIWEPGNPNNVVTAFEWKHKPKMTHIPESHTECKGWWY